MTMEILERILEENGIPKDVHFMSDSGWECDATEMNGVFYNRQRNTIVFTQDRYSERGEYEQSEEWEILYGPDLIKLEGLEVYPVSSVMSYGITDAFKKALKAAGDFENYYGISETEDKYDEINLNRPLYYSIKIREHFIGYIGFHEEGNALELEIYIFEPYRNRGYGTKVLKRFIDIAFKDGLLKKWREKNTENPPPVYSLKKEMVFPSKLVSTIRVENEYSGKMMLTCGFHENKEIAMEFLIFQDKNEKSEVDFVQVRKFELSKEEWNGNRR